MVYSRIEMLIIFLITNIFLNIYNWKILSGFDNWSAYHPANCMILITLSIVTLGVFKIFKNRQEKTAQQYNDICLSEKKLQTTLLSVIEMNKKIKCSEKDIKYIAYHDHLTGLPNRLLLSEKLNHAIFLSSHKDKMIATMFLDLDNFKMFNDTLGHDIGDQLLVEVSKRLVNTLRECDTVARIGGVERKNQLDFLIEGMCDEIQRYYYFKPMPVHEVEELLKKSLKHDFISIS